MQEKARLTVTDLNKLSLLGGPRPIPRDSSLPPRPPKRPLLANLRSERGHRNEDNAAAGCSRGFTSFEPPEAPRRSVLFLPQQSFECSSEELAENPEERPMFASVRVGRAGQRESVSERYQRKMEVLKEVRPPRVSQQLLTISHFTQEALSSIPRHVEIFNEKLRLLKKSATPTADVHTRRKEAADNPMPLELRTLRVVRNSSSIEGRQLTRKTSKLRMYLTKRVRKPEARPEVYRIEGWPAERQKPEFD